MKATLEFNLDEIDDRLAHARCIHATDMALALWEIQMNLNKQIERKLEAIELKGDQQLTAFDGKELVLEEIRQILEDHGVPDMQSLIH